MTDKTHTNPSYRSKSNPLWGKKKHSLIVDAQGASNRTIQTESGVVRFENGVAALENDDRAKDIYDELKVKEASHPNQYSFIGNKPLVNTDKTHRYYFGSQPGMPWAAYDELGRRLKDPDIEENANDKST